MRFHKPLDHILGTKSRVAVLRHLVQDDREQSGREIAREIGMSPKPLNQTLNQLVNEGVLLRRSVGNTYLFRLNWNNCLVAEQIARLFEAEKSLLSQAVRELTEDVTGILSVILYGSVSRGDERPSSDIDLLIVTAHENGVRARLDERMMAFVHRYGNVPSYIVMSLVEFQQGYQNQDDFLRHVLETGRTVYGRPPTELIGDAG